MTENFWHLNPADKGLIHNFDIDIKTWLLLLLCGDF
jgi:hypothetical protein